MVLEIHAPKSQLQEFGGQIHLQVIAPPLLQVRAFGWDFSRVRLSLILKHVLDHG